MTWLPAAIAAFFIGCAASAVFFSRTLNAARARQQQLGERAAGAEQALESEKENSKKILNEFRIAAHDVLKETRLEGAGEIENKRELIEKSVTEMKERLNNTEQKIEKFQNERKLLEGKFMQGLETVLGAAQSIDRQAAALKQAMISSSGTRGSYGQDALEQLLDQNGLQKGLHYETQVSITSDLGLARRPDFVIFLPGDGRLAIDAKEMAGEFFKSIETDNEAQKKEHLLKLAANIRTNFTELSKRDYAAHLDSRMPIVIMFISNEAAFRAAMSVDPSLYEDALQRQIFLTSPQTIIPMIHLIRLAWQQQTLAENAQELGRVVEELGSRLFTFMDHFQNIGRTISSAVTYWDKAVGSWDTRITPQLDRVRDLGGKFKDSPELSAIGKTPRVIEKSTAALPQ